MNRRIGICLLACTLLGWVSPSIAAESHAALRDMAVFLDADGRETLAGVLQEEERGGFVPLPADNLAGGYTRQVHWIRFTLAAPAGTWWLEILPPYLDDLRLYAPAPRSDEAAPVRFEEHRAGDRLPFADREIPYRGFVFELRQPDDQPRTYYLRLATTSTHLLVPRLWGPAQFYPAVVWETGLLFGALAVLLTVLLLNLNTWFWLRDPLSGRFIAYVASLFLSTASTTGLVFQYLFPAFPAIADPWPGVTALLAMATGNAFYQRLFDIDPAKRLLYLLYQSAIWAPLAAIPLVLLGHLPDVMPPLLKLTLLMTLIGLALSFRLWRRSEVGAGLMFAANLISLSGVLVILLALLGIVAGGQLPLYSLQVSSLGAALSLHLALGMRLRMLRTERQEQAQRATLAHLEAQRERAAREEQSALFAMISHEVKTPLAMIDAAVQSLAAMISGAPEVDRRCQRIRRAVARLNAVVEKTLEYDQVGQDAHVLQQRAALDLTELAAHMISGYGLPQTRLRLGAEDPCPVLGNAGLLEILLANLVDNALKYSPPDSQVEVRIRAVEREVRLEVCDQGPGIPKDLRPMLFERYIRGSHQGDIPGTGLGLFLVRRIARAHGGEVSCLDVVGTGTCLCVRLPLLNAPLPS